MINKSYVMAIAVTGGVVAASAWLMKRMTNRRQADEHELALEVWDNECGPPAAPPALPATAG